MAYPNFIGEFVAPFEKDAWPTLVKWNERPPVKTHGMMNPWEAERIRVVWLKEKEAWPKIQSLGREYKNIQVNMLKDIGIFNAHLSELERVIKKKVGISPIGGYAVMAATAAQLALSLASMSIPGVGWAIAIYTVVDLVITTLQGNLKKKRIKGLMLIMEEARLRLVANQKRLIAIQEELKFLIEVTARTVESIRQTMQRDIDMNESYRQIKEQQQAQALLIHERELATIRQITPNRVVYGNVL